MTTVTAPRERFLWADLIRAAAAYGVVFTHVAMNIVYYWDKKPLVRRGDEVWWTTSVYYAFLARSALGLFFMISGYLLLPSRMDTLSFLRKRLWKLFVPLVFWGAFYILWNGDYPQDPVKAARFILNSLAVGNIEFHLWFLYTFIGLYLFIPILSVFIKDGKESDIWYYVAVWFLLTPILTLAFNVTGVAIVLAENGFFSGFIGFFLLGYLIGRRDFNGKWVILAWILIPLWAGAETYGMVRETRIEKFMDDKWFDTLTIHVAPYTVLMFIALKGLGHRIQTGLTRNSKIPGVLEIASRASLGIILIHVVVLDIMYTGIGGIHLTPHDFHPVVSIPVVSTVCYVISFALVYLIQRIPILRHIVAA